MTFSEELKEILSEELDILKEVKNLAFEKTDIIIESNIERLEEILKEEEKLANNIGTLELSRIELLDTWGIDQDMPISHIVERVPENKEELIHISNNMSEIIDKLRERNNLNNDLIKENLDWIDFNMNLITSMKAPTNYGRDNKTSHDPSGNNIFDRKV